MQDINTIHHRVKLLFAFLIFTILKINGQDMHYSQFYNTPQNINPALTGLFNGDHRFTASMRDQWRFVPVPWFTFSGAYDRKLYVLKGEKHFLGAGAIFNHDRQGDGKLNLTSLSVNAAYHRLLTPNHIVSGGLVLGFASRGFDSQSFTWDHQWNGDAFIASLGSGEGFDNFERVSFLESGAGFNYRYQKSSRTFADIGIGALHLIKPNTAFYGTAVSKLPSRITLSAVGQIKVADILDIQLSGLHHKQGVYNEIVVGGLGKIYLSQKRGKETQLHLGLGYRTAGSWIPTGAFQYNNIYVGFSYDIDKTGFNETVKISRGGPEVHVRYFIANVKPLKAAKVCPIY